MTRRKKTLIIVASILALLVIINFALEPVTLHYANKTLAELKGYRGSIKDVDIHLYRGAYRIDSLEIVKTGAGKEQPFFSAKEIDVSIEWKSLFKGAIVGEFLLRVRP